MELSVINEAQVVFVHVVLEREENHGEDRYVGYEGRENHGDSEGCQAVRHMVAQVEGVGIYKLLGSLFTSLFRIVAALLDRTNQCVGDVEQPKSNRQEHQLDEVSDEEVVVGEKLLGKELRPSLKLLLLYLPKESLDSRETCQIEEEHVREHEKEVPVQ